MMSKKNEKKDLHSVSGDNVIPFPESSSPSRSRGKKDVEPRTRFTINFEPDWDFGEDDPPDSKT